MPDMAFGVILPLTGGIDERLKVGHPFPTDTLPCRQFRSVSAFQKPHNFIRPEAEQKKFPVNVYQNFFDSPRKTAKTLSKNSTKETPE